jgi:L-fuculose-phosphate aldolase
MRRQDAAAIRRAIVRACRRLDAKGLVAGAEGNVSARVGSGMLITPAGWVKAEVTVASLTDPRRASRAYTPSSEWRMHHAIYDARPDVMAVVHAHPPFATGFAVAHVDLRLAGLAELAGVIGPVPRVPYHPPGSASLGAAVAVGLADADACLLANHGAVTVGRTVTEALSRMESLEQGARILVTAHILGGVTELGRRDVLVLDASRRAARGSA